MEVELIDAGKTWIQEHHPQGVVWEYDPGKSFKRLSVTAVCYEPTYLGIPYRIPSRIDGRPIIRKTKS